MKELVNRSAKADESAQIRIKFFIKGQVKSKFMWELVEVWKYFIESLTGCWVCIFDSKVVNNFGNGKKVVK